MAPASRSNPLIGHGTHVGNIRPLNEDFYGIKSFRTVDGHWATLAVVGDGSGGYRAGDLTSKLAVEAITEFIEKSNGRNYLKLLEHAVNEAGRQIFERTRSILDHRVGTTCAVSLVIDGRLYIVYVGNSRVYLIGKRWGIRQASIDGTVLQALIEQGLLTQEEALQHPRHYYGLSLLVGTAVILQVPSAP